MNANQLINEALMENPDIQVVPDNALRARETEARELPREIGISTEMAAIPIDLQYVLLGNHGVP